jgi:hypothetical protein
MMKLIGKETVNNRIKKIYDLAKTPYRRILESELLSDEIKSSIAEEYDLIDSIQLWEQLGFQPLSKPPAMRVVLIPDQSIVSISST